MAGVAEEIKAKYRQRIDVLPIQRRAGYLYYIKADGYIWESPTKNTLKKLMGA